MTRIPAISRKDSEIRQIEDDLRSCANLELPARRLRAGFYILITVLTTFTLMAAIIGHWPVFLLSTALLVITILPVWANARRSPQLRLIDYAGDGGRRILVGT
jgi:hypothetical protein